jgi:hypothetical protein
MNLNDPKVLKGTMKAAKKNPQIDEQTEAELSAYAKDIHTKIKNGELDSWSVADVVRAYMKLASNSFKNEKQATKIKVRLLKTPKKVVIDMLDYAIKTTFKELD